MNISNRHTDLGCHWNCVNNSFQRRMEFLISSATSNKCRFTYTFIKKERVELHRKWMKTSWCIWDKIPTWYSTYLFLSKPILQTSIFTFYKSYLIIVNASCGVVISVFLPYTMTCWLCHRRKHPRTWVLPRKDACLMH